MTQREACKEITDDGCLEGFALPDTNCVVVHNYHFSLCFSSCCSERKRLLFSGSRLPSEQLKLPSSFLSFSPLHYGLPHSSSPAPPRFLEPLNKLTRSKNPNTHWTDWTRLWFPRKRCVWVGAVETVSLAEVPLVLCICNGVVSITVSVSATSRPEPRVSQRTP